MGVGGKRHALAALPPGKMRHLLYGLGGHQGRSRRVRKISPPRGFDPPNFRPVASYRRGRIYIIHKGAQLKFKPKHTGT